MKTNYAVRAINKYGVLNIFLCILFMGLILHGGGRQLYNMIYSWKNQIPYEFRSYAGIGFSELIKEGINPYNSMSMENVMVPIVYVYPVLQPLMAAIISQLSGISMVAAHYLIAICVMLLTPLVLVIYCYKHTNHLWHILAGCCLIVTISSTSRFYPGAVALLLFVILYGSILYNPSNPFSIWLAILTYALLLTKQTFVVISIGIVIYLTFINRNCLMKYLLHLVWMGILLLLITYYFFPAYFAESLYITQCSTHSSLEHLLNQLKDLVRYYGWLIGTVCGLSIYCLYKKRRLRDSKWMFLFFCAISLVTNGISASYFAQNVGAKYTYFQELMGVPLAFLVSIVPSYFEEIPFRCFNGIYIKIKEDILTILVVVLLFSCNGIADWQSDAPDLKEYSENYSRAYSIIDKYRREGPVFISSTLAEYASLYCSEGVYYDWGQLVYCRGNRLNNENGIMKKLFFNKAIEMTTLVDYYLDKVDEMIIKGEFSLITISSLETQVNKEYLEENYLILEEIPLCHCIGQKTTEQIWVKKDIIK